MDGLRLKELDSSLDIAILERDLCGGGASGRNGGIVLSWWPKLPSLVKQFGTPPAIEVAAQSEQAIGEVVSFCEDHGIEAGARRDGWLWTATTPAQLDAWDSCVSLCEQVGFGPFQRLDPAAVARRAGSPTHLAGVFDPTAATLHPAALARGLRRVALGRGVRIYEHSPVIELPRDERAPLPTPRGTLTAGRRIIAMGAWAAGLRGLRRSLVIVSSDVVATPPVPEWLERIGLNSGVGITNSQQMVDYYRRTPDGRIVFGKGGWGIALGARIGSTFDHDERRVAATVADFRRIYPDLRDVPIETAWSGPIDRSATGLPIFGRLPGSERTVYGVGWSGNGIAPSWIGGRILASMSLGRADEWSAHPLVRSGHERFPPEPIRFVGAHIVRAGVQRKEAAEAQGERPGWLSRQLASLVPAGLEDS